MTDFYFNTAKSIHFENGGANHFSELVTPLFEKETVSPHILFVTDPGILELGLAEPALTSLRNAGFEITIYGEVEADPPASIIKSTVASSKDLGITGVVGFGGGSSMDVAKLIAYLVNGEENLEDIYGINQTKGQRLPLVLVPTTSGTGSEVTPISIVTTGKNEKMGVVSPEIIPDLAILDPQLTMGLPPHITAATGIDAMVHAIEAYTSASPNNNPISKNLARTALSLMASSLETAVHNGSDVSARSDMLLGSMMAGQAFANSPVAAVHALAYPLGGHFHIPHGLSNSLVLPHVLRFNIRTAPEPYSELALFAFPELKKFDGDERAEAFCDTLRDLSQRCGLQQHLSQMDIPQDFLPTLAKDAMNQTRLLVNNPRVVTELDALSIYKAAW